MKITALNHMFCWTPDTADVALVPWPDYARRSDRYDFTTLACNTATHRMTDIERVAHVLAEAVCAMTRDGCPPAAVHACLLGLEEYRAAMPEDNQRVYADAYLRGNQWIIPACPLCGCQHVHGAPEGIHDKGGHRVAHCAPLAGGYFIQPSAPPGRDAGRQSVSDSVILT